MLGSVDGKDLPIRRPASITLAIGPIGLKAAIAADVRGAVVALFCSNPSYRQLVAEAAAWKARVQVTAIYAEPSAAVQVQLAAAIYQRHITIGVLLGDVDSAYSEALHRASRQHDVGLVLANHQPSGNPVRELVALASAEALLAIPDTTIWSPDYVREMLESAYRRRQGVIGFSPSLVAAGALAAPYATIDDVLDHLQQVIAEIEAGRSPDPAYPAFWRVSINEGVARSLDLVLTDEVRSLARSPEKRR